MKNVGVIGAGTMGQGIANAFATAGYNGHKMESTKLVLN